MNMQKGSKIRGVSTKPKSPITTFLGINVGVYTHEVLQRDLRHDFYYVRKWTEILKSLSVSTTQEHKRNYYYLPVGNNFPALFLILSFSLALSPLSLSLSLSLSFILSLSFFFMLSFSVILCPCLSISFFPPSLYMYICIVGGCGTENSPSLHSLFQTCSPADKC